MRRPNGLRKCGPKGAPRVRWWIETYRDGKRIGAESGLNAASDHSEVVGAKLIELQNQILKARSATMDGVRVKLAVLAHMAALNGYTDFHGNLVEPVEEWNFFDRSLYNLHLDAERLAGGVACAPWRRISAALKRRRGSN